MEASDDRVMTFSCSGRFQIFPRRAKQLSQAATPEHLTCPPHSLLQWPGHRDIQRQRRRRPPKLQLFRQRPTGFLNANRPLLHLLPNVRGRSFQIYLCSSTRICALNFGPGSSSSRPPTLHLPNDGDAKCLISTPEEDSQEMEERRRRRRQRGSGHQTVQLTFG